MKEFLGIGGYQREPEGFLSPQHIAFVSLLMLTMVFLAIFFGRKYKDRDIKNKNHVLMWAAILIDSFEIFKLVVFGIRSNDPWSWLYDLPLFLCSIQLITIPLAAFAKGRVKEAALDFVMIFGILGAVMGTIGAGQNYGCYPVLSIDNVVSGITHSISGFASLYIMISGMGSMKKKNMPITFAILGFFAVAAGIANYLLDYNYMFLRRGDGTPYDIIFNLVGGNQIIYPLLVIALFVVYILIFHETYQIIVHMSQRDKAGEVVENAEQIKTHK